MTANDKKKIALITGASSGIGKAFAEILSAEDYDLVLVARNIDELNRIAGMEMTKHGTKVIPVKLDLIQPGAIDKLMAELKERKINPDILINNAGIGLNGNVVELSTTDQLQMIDLNARSLTEMTMKFLPAMIKRGSGGIINVSSVAAFLPGPYMSVYYATKAYVQSFSKGLTHELKGTKIRLMTLCPGPVETQFQSTAGLDTNRLVFKLMMPRSAHDVAQAGWSGFKAGNNNVYPGLMDMLTAWSAKMLPHFLLMPLIKLFQKPK